ncbi:MAG: hypothetical protein KDB01_05145, partial [Planctomycetaceae bacterium]|nr:hypothetical protein [Planctomycetaceae bacterium]
IRSKYGLNLTAECVAAFHGLAGIANQTVSKKVRIPDFIRTLATDGHRRYWRAFLEAAANAAYLSPVRYDLRRVILRTACFDSEFLLTSVFGVQIAIPGFSELFGGGLRLGLPVSNRRNQSPGTDGPVGRVILVRGDYGAGKSVLTQTLAADVARKGGVAVIIVLEATFQETCASLAHSGVDTSGKSFQILNTLEALAKHLKHQTAGVLAILSHFDDEKDESGDHIPVTYEQVLSQLQAYGEGLPSDRLRLLAIDPINALLRNSPKNNLSDALKDVNAQQENDGRRSTERFNTLKALQSLKKSGCNLVLTAEEEDEGWIRFGEDISDTVIRLSDKDFGRYVKRVISVTKSRLQREHRGAHPFSILSGKGIDITLSTAAVSVSQRSRRVTRHDAGRFGLESLEKVLRTNLKIGDILLVRGPVGTLKTQLGIAFLFGARHRFTPKEKSPDINLAGMVISNRLTHDALEEKRRSLFRERNLQESQRRIFTCKIPKGFYTAGQLLREIENTFQDAAAEGFQIDRVLLDNPSEWTDSCPLTEHDPAFPQTLLGTFLRRRNVVTFVTDRMLTSESLWSRILLEEADARIDLGLVELHGAEHITLKVRKTQSMLHSRQLHILSTSCEEGMEVREAYFDLGKDGLPTPLSVRLLGHVETAAQHDYWQNKIATIRSAVTPNADFQVLNRFNLGFSLDFAKSSASQEVQILALDEFELEWGKEKGLRLLSYSAFGGEANNVPNRIFLPAKHSNDQLIAVPIYDNLSLLTVRGQVSFESWEDLAVLADQAGEDVFFDFPKGTAENYNCLFLEILLSLIRTPTKSRTPDECENDEKQWFRPSGTDGKVDITTLLKHDLATKAAAIFARLGRNAQAKSLMVARAQRAQRLMRNPANSSTYGEYTVSESARVARHWFTTLFQHVDAHTDCFVKAMPQDVSTSGQWYLGVPRNSRASSLAEEILESLTTREADVDRLNQFVGLPVREEMYFSNGPTDAATVVPLSELTPSFFRELASHPIQRSVYSGYSAISTTIAEHLIQLLSATKGLDTAAVPDRAAATLRALCESIKFINQQRQRRPLLTGRPR